MYVTILQHVAFFSQLPTLGRAFFWFCLTCSVSVISLTNFCGLVTLIISAIIAVIITTVNNFIHSLLLGLLITYIITHIELSILLIVPLILTF